MDRDEKWIWFDEQWARIASIAILAKHKSGSSVLIYVNGVWFEELLFSDMVMYRYDELKKLLGISK